MAGRLYQKGNVGSSRHAPIFATEQDLRHENRMTPASVRTTVISGASSGIGAALARRLAGRPRAHLGLVGRNAARLESVAADCRALGAATTLASLDVRDRAGLAAWLEAFDAVQPVDLVVANAGIAASSLPGGHPERAEHVYEVLDVNLWGALNLVLPLLPRMRARRTGQVALMSSLSAFAPLPGAEAYSASKAALLTFGLALRQQLAPDGVGVSVICPGFVTSPMSQLFAGAKPLEMSAEAAAGYIERGLARNARLIAFPRSMALAARLSGLVPEAALRPAMRFFRL